MVLVVLTDIIFNFFVIMARLFAFLRRSNSDDQKGVMRTTLQDGKTTNLPLKAMTDAPIRRRFFDANKEYANVKKSDSDVSVSDLTSEASNYSFTENGYSSDVSDAVLSSGRDSNVIKKRRKRFPLDPSKMESFSDAEENMLMTRKPLRKPKAKDVKNTNTSYDYLQIEGETIYADGKHSREHRLSWTDSGVSLSRTDQSQCGTMKKTDIKKDDENNSDTDDKILTQDSELLKETDQGETTTQDNSEISDRVSLVLRRGRNSFSSTREQNNLNRLSLMTDRSSLTNITILSSNQNSRTNSFSSLDDDYTSTTYATSGAEQQEETDTESVQSFVENKNIENITVENKQGLVGEIEVVVHQKDQNSTTSDAISVNSSKSEPYESRRRGSSILQAVKKVTEHFKPKFKNKSTKDVSAEFSCEITQADKNRIAFEELTAHVFGKMANLETSDEEGFKRLSQTFDQANYEQNQTEVTDVTDGKTVDGTKDVKERESLFNILDTNKQKEITPIEDSKEEMIKDYITQSESSDNSSAYMEGTIEHDNNNDEKSTTTIITKSIHKPELDVLEQTFTIKRVKQNQNFFRKLFRKSSKSFSVEKIVKKTKVKSPFIRNTSERGSARSIPDNFGKSPQQVIPENHHEPAHKSKSLNHIDAHDKISVSTTECNDRVFERRQSCPTSTEIQANGLTRSLTSLDEPDKIVSIKQHSASTPNTPLMMRKTPPVMINERNFDSNHFFASTQRSGSNHNFSHHHRPPHHHHNPYDVNINCGCDECLYNEYMDFLAFQQFKRAGGFQNMYPYQSVPVPYMMTPPHMTPTPPMAQLPYHPVNNSFHSIDRSHMATYQRTNSVQSQGRENVIAPLSMTVEKERKAKTLKTSMYDTFV